MRASAVLWFTGLSGSGKSTLGSWVAGELRRRGGRVEELDGDVMRQIFPETGFTREEREAHLRRAGYLASILERNDITVVATFISPYASSRDFVRRLCRRFVEIHVATPLVECERRDVKGLYARARRGEITHFTGVDDPYEAPANPEVVLNTQGRDIVDVGVEVLAYLSTLDEEC